MNLAFRKSNSSSGGFTLIELLVCSLILSVSAVGIINLLRMSDGVAIRGRLDSRVALVFKDVVDRISTYPSADFAALVAAAPVKGPSGSVFTYGAAGGGFPFIPGQLASLPRYLLMGKPLPGSSTPVGSYPYTIVVEVLDQTTHYRVRVTLEWKGYRDRVVSGVPQDSRSSVFLEFQKWNAARS